MSISLLRKCGIRQDTAEFIDHLANNDIEVLENSGALYVKRESGGLMKILELPGPGQAMYAESYVRNKMLQNTPCPGH